MSLFEQAGLFVVNSIFLRFASEGLKAAKEDTSRKAPWKALGILLLHFAATYSLYWNAFSTAK